VVALGPEHADGLFATCAAPGTEHLWTYLADGPFPDREAFAARIAATVADPGSVSVAVLAADATPLGLANYMRLDPRNGSVEVGGILFGTRLQRTRAATEAMYLMARHVFEDLGYRRYEWKCDALNAPSRAAALRLGFAYEGTHRQAVVYKGRSRDTGGGSTRPTSTGPAPSASRSPRSPPRCAGTCRGLQMLGPLFHILGRVADWLDEGARLRRPYVHAF
jgi:RimJ/RimL family protein N-acetyltransferase